MSELPFLGVRPGMFEGAMRCPKCGFATSDPNVFECPNCQLVWKQRPKKLGIEKGQKVQMTCSECQGQILPGQDVVFAGLSGTLAHENCLAGVIPSDEDEASQNVAESFLDLIKGAQPVDGGAQYRDPSALQPEWQQDQAAMAAFLDAGKPAKPKRSKNTPCACPPIIKDGRQVGRRHEPPCPR